MARKLHTQPGELAAGAAPRQRFSGACAPSSIPMTFDWHNLSRGWAIAAWCPFSLASSALDKLRFVHETMGSAAGRTSDNGNPVAACRG